jgi:endonuclease/exonuclease/phosphatase family metal-dependent hydrolase
MDVLLWNLYHGRAVPPAGRYLLDEYTAALVGWEWDVALLQEVPPWWPPHLARACGADQRTALTSRNFLLPLRRAIATRWPDLIKSNGGGSNAILVRGGAITAHRKLRLRWLPERRVVHGVRMADGTWAANLHATVHSPARAGADAAKAAGAVLAWAAGGPALLGGDFNVPAPVVPGFQHAGGRHVDHLFVRHLVAQGEARVLRRGTLSDHAPVMMRVAPAAATPPEAHTGGPA